MLFRRRFNNLRLEPLLDYKKYRQNENDGGVFRFFGSFESITDNYILWIKGEGLTVSVSLKKTKCWLLLTDEEGSQDALKQIRWDHVSTISEGTRVFVGGKLENVNGRLSFVSSKDEPLTVIFYNCSEKKLTNDIIRCARTKNEYWNIFTPVSIVIGALSLFYIAASFLNRPAYRPTVIISFVLVFAPVLPVFPPGILFTVLYRRMTWHARRYRSYFDLVRLPLRYLPPGQARAVLSNGETYGCIKPESLAENEDIPFLYGDIIEDSKKATPHFFGIIEDNSPLPVQSKDPFVCYGLLPYSPQRMSIRYAIKAYIIEFIAWIILLAGIAANIIFIMLILIQYQVLSF